MLITCRDLEEFPYFSKIKLVAGSEGLDRAITWPYVCQSADISQWVNGGELVFITGMETNYTEEILLKMFQECYTCSVAGVVLLCNEEFISQVPTSLIEEANKLKLPLYEMPWMLKIVNISKSLANSIIQASSKEHTVRDFFYELLFSPRIEQPIINQLALQLQVDLELQQFIIIFSFNDDTNYKLSQLDLLKHELLRILGEEVLLLIRGDTIIAYNQISNKKTKELVLKHLEESLNEYKNTQTLPPIAIGVGYSCGIEDDIRSSYSEALRSMSIAKKNSLPVSIKCWSDSSFLRMIPGGDNMPAIINFCGKVLGVFVSSDKEYNTNYILTLRHYLECNGNLKDTAQSLFIHRNTLVYRLGKMTDLSGRDLTQLNQRVDFVVALKVADFYEILSEL